MTEHKHRGRRLVVEMRTRATPEEVYAAWAEPDEIARWFVDKARGKAEVGSIFTWIFEKFGYEIPYEVVAAEPGRRFALGGEAPGSGPFLLEVKIEREGGETLVTLVNSGFLDGSEWDEELEGIASGWTNALAALKLSLERYPGRNKTTILAMKKAGDYGYGQLLPYYATGEGLNRGLTTSAEIGEVGAPCSLRFSSGRTLSGRVLARTAWEVALSWDEIHGMLELKGFRFPGVGKVVGARVLSWDMPADAAALERDLESALEKLAGELRSEVPAGART